jgi:pyruvate kinase
VFDGTDAVMLSGETANGSFPEDAVKTMAAIAANAELVNNYYATYSFIRDFSPKPFSPEESLASNAAKAVIDCKASLCIVVCTDGVKSRSVSKYRPSVPVVVLTSTEWVAKQSNSYFGQYACMLDQVSCVLDRTSMQSGGVIDKGIQFAKNLKLLPAGQSAVVIIAEDSTGAIGVSFCNVNA